MPCESPYVPILPLTAPALAAMVACPASCSCLLPAEARKIGYPGTCGDRQQVCGYDTQKNEKYCYENLVRETHGGALPSLRDRASLNMNRILRKFVL